MFKKFTTLGFDGRDESHKYVQYSKKPLEGRIPYATLLLTEQYIRSKKQSAKQWKKDKSISYVYWKKNKIDIKSEPINYSVIMDNIKTNNLFQPSLLNLPFVTEDFLDVPTLTGMTSHNQNPYAGLESSIPDLGGLFPD